MDREARAKHAEQLLNDPLFNEAFEAVEKACLEQWQATKTNDNESRERIWMMVKLNQRLKQHYLAIIDDGKIAAAEVAELERNSAVNRITGIFNR